MVINQGDIFWVDLGRPSGSAPGFERPYVVIQNNVFNQSQIRTVIVCALTSNLMRGAGPGNVVLGKGEGQLAKRSVVNVSQLFTLDKSALVRRIGTLSRERIREILEGVYLMLAPRDLGD
jgi:mRNA interferase MazF